MSHNYILGVDIGGTNIRIGLVDENNQLHHFQKLPQEEILTGEDTVKSLSIYLQDYIEKNISNDKIDALVVGIPAAMSKDRTTVWNAPNINGFSGKNVHSILQQHFDFPCLLERDVTLLFYADLYKNNIPHEDILIGCYLGTGLGNVISVNGTPLIGNDGAVGELGHIPVWDKTDLCSCGNEGCMESHVGGKYLVKLIKDVFPNVDIQNIFTEKGNTPEIEKYIEHISIPITTEINILNPAYIVLGGGVISMKDFPKEKLEKYIYKHARKPFPAENLHIVYSDDDSANGIYGCALYARNVLKIN